MFAGVLDMLCLLYVVVLYSIVYKSPYRVTEATSHDNMYIVVLKLMHMTHITLNSTIET